MTMNMDVLGAALTAFVENDTRRLQANAAADVTAWSQEDANAICTAYRPGLCTFIPGGSVPQNGRNEKTSKMDKI